MAWEPDEKQKPPQQPSGAHADVLRHEAIRESWCRRRQYGRPDDTPEEKV